MTSAESRQFQEAVEIVESKLGGLNSNSIEVLLLAAYSSLRAEQYSKSAQFIGGFYKHIDKSKSHSMMEKLYLAAYASWCEKIVVKELGTQARFGKYGELDSVNLNLVSKRLKRIFPLVVHPDWKKFAV